MYINNKVQNRLKLHRDYHCHCIYCITSFNGGAKLLEYSSSIDGIHGQVLGSDKFSGDYLSV